MIHGSEEFDKPLQLKLNVKIAHAAFVAGVSSFGRSQIWRWARLGDWAKVHIIRCGLDSVFLDAPIVAPPAAPRLVCVGRLCGEKAQLLLLEACALLTQRGIDWSLTLAGDGDQRPMVEAAIARLGLADRVTITGWLTAAEVIAAIEAARVFVLPSFAEGVPVVLMEAMALGRIAVTSRITGIPELVDDGVNGFLVTAGDVEALAVTIARALALGDDERAAMAAHARGKVRRLHSVDTEVAKLRMLFEASAKRQAG